MDIPFLNSWLSVCFPLLTLRVFGSFLNSMYPHFFLQGGSISTDIKIYASMTLGKKGPLTSTFSPSQDFPDSSVGKDSACKAEDISSIPGQWSFGGERISYPLKHSLASLWLSWSRIHLQCEMPGLDPWFVKIPWSKESLPTLVFLPGEFHGLYSSWFTKLRTRLNNFHFPLFRPSNLLPSPNSKYFSQSCNRALKCDSVKWW